MVALVFPRPDAEQAINNLHGVLIGTCAIRCTWGRNPSAKQVGHQQTRHSRHLRAKRACPRHTRGPDVSL